MRFEPLRRWLGALCLAAAQRLLGTTFAEDTPEVLRIGVYRRPAGPRWGWGRPPHPQLLEVLNARTQAYLDELELIRRYGADLAAIDHGHRTDFEPCWQNPLFIGLDGASLYAYLRDRAPRRYVEIGSGYSTRFAARAKRDGALATELIAIDPEPRVGLGDLCDQVLRTPLESVDQGLFADLGPGDVVFFDGSHRVLMGNDVVVFFLEILPRMAPGVRVGVHDIYLPEDYGPGIVNDFWTEQYMLAMALLADESLVPVLPCHHVATTSPTTERLNELWNEVGLGDTNAWGSAFWLERA